MPDHRAEVPCSFAARGQCRKGVNCPFSHTGAALPPREWRGSDTGPQGPDSRRMTPCRFLLKSACLKGSKCPFLHDTSGTGDEQERPYEENWCRQLKGALVRFTNGAAVAKVNFPCDFSAVRISNLPPTTTQASVSRLLASHDFTVAEDCIRITKPPAPEACENTTPLYNADVRVENPDFAKRICSLLGGGDYGEEAPRATPINAPMPQTSNTRRVDSRKIYCSWHKPSRTAWLNFGDGGIARAVATGFSTGRYKILGHRAEASSPVHGGGHRNPLGWSVTVSDIPMAVASALDVTRSIAANMRPRRVEMSAESYEVDLDLANATVESLLLQSGPLEWYQGAKGGTTGKRFKATARFLSDQDAREAVDMLHDKPLEFHTNGKLTVHLVHSVRLKIPARVYQAVEDEIEGHKAGWKDKRLLYVAYPPVQGLRVVKIEGQIDKDVASAKAMLERTLEGEVVRTDNGDFLWTTSLISNGADYQKMRQIESEHDVTIIRDKRKSQLRLLGRPPPRQLARTALLNLVAEAEARATAQCVFAIDLDNKQFSQAFRGGYRAVAAAVGEDKVAIDIVSVPRRILVTGLEADFTLAKQVWQQQQHGGDLASLMGAVTLQPGIDCAVCWTEAENPVRTTCGHVYCGGCFEDLCIAGAGTSGGIVCPGDAGTCNTIIPLEDLQTHLSSAALEDVLETAFATHTARNPADIKPCPTPDCGQLYRAGGIREGESATVFTCPECFGAVCTACGVGHAGMTCAEHRDLQEGGPEAMRATRLKLGIKDCPRCGIGIEKRSGCNHMTCSCGAHICWVCMKTFAEGGEVYAHMGREHGGIGL